MSTIQYLYRFPTRAAAQSDPVIGLYFNPPTTGLFDNILVCDSQGSTPALPLQQYWVMLIFPSPVVTSLFQHPNLMLCLDLTAQSANQSNFALFVAPGISSNVIILITPYMQSGWLATVTGPFRNVAPIPVTDHPIDVDTGIPLEYDTGKPIEYQ